MNVETSPVFTLVIDEERSELLTVMFAMAIKDWPNFERAYPERADVLKKCGLELLKEVSDKTHERGWCKDPNCPDNQH